MAARSSRAMHASDDWAGSRISRPERFSWFWERTRLACRVRRRICLAQLDSLRSFEAPFPSPRPSPSGRGRINGSGCGLGTHPISSVRRTESPLLGKRGRVRGKGREDGSEHKNLEATLNKYSASRRTPCCARDPHRLVRLPRTRPVGETPAGASETDALPFSNGIVPAKQVLVP
jgi:hypothetical protein